MVSEFQRVLEAHRERLERMIVKHGLAPMRKVYSHAMSELEGRLAALVGRGDGASFSAHQARAMLVQVRQAEIRLSHQLAAKLGPGVREIQSDTLRNLIRDVTRLEKHYKGAAIELPIEEAARFNRIVDKRRSSLLRQHEKSFARYGARVVSDAEGVLGTASATGMSGMRVVDELMKTVDGTEWEATRIARTESAWGASAVSADGIAEAAREVPDLEMRWTEFCNEDGSRRDDRTAVDSLAMNGQVARPGQLFTMPPTSPHPDAKGRTQVPEGLVGRRWEFPPDRPLDRACLMAFRPDWGVPGWRWAGRRVPI